MEIYQKRTSSLHIEFGHIHQSLCSCTTTVFFYPSLWVEGWVWKAWLTSVRALGDTRVLYATCQRLNDGSHSTPAQLSLHSVNVHGLYVHVGSCVCVWGGVCVWLYIWMCLCVCVFLRSRVNYIGHDVKGRSLVGENTASSTQQLPWRQHW